MDSFVVEDELEEEEEEEEQEEELEQEEIDDGVFIEEEAKRSDVTEVQIFGDGDEPMEVELYDSSEEDLIQSSKGLVIDSPQPAKAKKTDGDCVVCLDTIQAKIAFIPCGHVCCCSNCSKKMRKCPLCRAVVQSSIKVFL